jgi:DNA-binding CsgD family transcriptional regulator
MALEPEDWEGINRCLMRLYQELDSQRHPRLMLELLNGLVPVDSSVVNFFKPPDQLTAIGFPEGLVTEERVATVGRYVHQSPFTAYYLATQDASWKMTTDFMPVEDFHKLDLYQVGLKPLGINQQMCGFLAFMDGSLDVITLHRTRQGFTERERDILNTLHPHLVTSFINAIVCSRAHNSLAQIKAVLDTAPGAYGYFDAHGKVGWLQEKAKAWLQESFPDEALHQELIPDVVQQLVRESLQEGRTPKQLTRAKANEVLVICLGASPVGGWIMRLERKPRTTLPRFRPLPQFSRRKNEVLQWMVEGKRNLEIAQILGLSPRTVEKHVSAILSTFNAENRASAILAAMEFCATGTTGC